MSNDWNPSEINACNQTLMIIISEIRFLDFYREGHKCSLIKTGSWIPPALDINPSERLLGVI